MHWRSWNVEIALMTTNRVDLIEPEDFINQVLEESVPAYVCHVTMIESCLPQVQFFWMAQISIATTETVTLPEAYPDLEDVFSAENAGHLPIHVDQNHVIHFIIGNNIFMGSLTAYPKMSCLFFEPTLTRNHLANGFIRPSKSPDGAPILFVPKRNRGLWLFVDYWDFNNLTIKNRYPLTLIGKSLDRLSRAKKYTKLDFTDTYYRICIKKRDEDETVFSNSVWSLQVLCYAIRSCKCICYFSIIYQQMFSREARSVLHWVSWWYAHLQKRKRSQTWCGRQMSIRAAEKYGLYVKLK